MDILFKTLGRHTDLCAEDKEIKSLQADRSTLGEVTSSTTTPSSSQNVDRVRADATLDMDTLRDPKTTYAEFSSNVASSAATASSFTVTSTTTAHLAVDAHPSEYRLSASLVIPDTSLSLKVYEDRPLLSVSEDATLSISHFPCTQCGSCNSNAILCSTCHDSLSIHIEHSPLSFSSLIYNSPLTSAERTAAVEHLNHLESDLGRLRFVTQQLTASCDALEGRAKLQRYRLAPIRRLPAEILTLVFAEVVDFNDVAIFGLMPAVTLSHVNRLWRDLANTSPELWTKIIITPMHDTDDNDTDGASSSGSDNSEELSQSFWLAYEITERLDHCLARSSNRPLDIEFHEDVNGDANPLIREEFWIFFSRLGDVAPRWRTLKGYLAIAFQLAPGSHKSLDCLKEVTFTDNSGSELDDNWPFLFLSRAPALRIVNLPRSIEMNLVITSALPPNQLTHFAGCLFFESFQVYSQITHLNLQYILPEPLNSLPIHLPCLLSLTIQEAHRSIGASRQLSCPLLKELTLVHGYIGRHGFFSNLASLISASRTPFFSSLALIHCTFVDCHIGDMLRSVSILSSVQHMDIDNCHGAFIKDKHLEILDAYDVEDAGGPKHLPPECLRSFIQRLHGDLSIATHTLACKCHPPLESGATEDQA